MDEKMDKKIEMVSERARMRKTYLPVRLYIRISTAGGFRSLLCVIKTFRYTDSKPGKTSIN